jgi:hypothetical protein
MSVMVLRKTPFALLAIGVALAVGAPTASGQAPVPGFAFPFPAAGLAGQQCGSNMGQFGQASTAGTNACAGPGLTFIGPAIGQVASVIGPTIIGPVQVGTLIVSGGAAAGGIP